MPLQLRLEEPVYETSFASLLPLPPPFPPTIYTYNNDDHDVGAKCKYNLAPEFGKDQWKLFAERNPQVDVKRLRLGETDLDQIFELR